MTKDISLFVVSILFLFTGCASKTEIEGFDSKAWKDDYKCCNGTREKLVKALLDKKDSLKKLADNDIIKLLGYPEKNDQFTREKKAYAYFITKGSQCDGDDVNTEGKTIVLEFSSIGKVALVRLANN